MPTSGTSTWTPAAASFARFLAGYEQHASLADDWPDGVDRIMSVREAEIFLLLSQEDIDATSVEAAFMDGRRARLLDRTPYLGGPLTSLL